jgi:hypothetical protein
MNVKEAVEKAKEALSNLLDDEEISDTRLEEVDKDVAASQWYVTLSYLPKELDPLDSPYKQRRYKVIKINDSGTFVSMKIRERELVINSGNF